MSDTSSSKDKDSSGAARQAAPASVHLGTDNLSSSYCNVCTANSTRDEVVLNFGINQDWDRRSPQLEIDLLKRIILSPNGAKRFNQRLAQVLAEYEKRFGELKL